MRAGCLRDPLPPPDLAVTVPTAYPGGSTYYLPAASLAVLFWLQVYAARGWPVDFYTKYSSCFQIKHCPNNLTAEDALALHTLEDGNVFHSSSLVRFPPIFQWYFESF